MGEPAADAPDGAEPKPAPLLHPAEGIPGLSITVRQIEAAARLLDSGRGPFAVDAERASGFRYSNRAYLIQIRRGGAGTVLIDPQEHIEYNETITTRDLTPDKVFIVEVFFPQYPELRIRQKFMTAR